MADRNEHTGASLVTKPSTDQYREGWDKIFGKREEGIIITDTPQDVYNQNHDPI